MTIIDFMHEHLFLTWLLAWGLWGAVWLAGMALETAYRLIGRVLRVLIIVARGWPPAHLDADGDWRPLPKVEDGKP